MCPPLIRQPKETNVTTLQKIVAVMAILAPIALFLAVAC